MTRGRFITFEGGEGAGKSTQIARLSEQLRARDLAVRVTREPGGTEFAEAIRTLVLTRGHLVRAPEAEALLFYAARADLLAGLIRPALASGTWVLCDRFSDSTRAYQGAASGASNAFIEALDRLVVEATRPDLTILLDIPAEIGLQRAKLRADRAAPASTPSAPDRFEQEDLAFHIRLREGFLAIARNEPDRFCVIDAATSVEAVATAIWRQVSERLLS